MTVPIPSARQLFIEEMGKPEEGLGLARACLLVAKEEYLQLPVEPYLARLDEMAEQVRDRLNAETAPLVVLQELITTLHGRRGMRGNRDDYYDPRNSFLNDVIDRGLGIPLTLGIVFLEVGWRLGLPLRGVNFPGHFLIRFQGDAVRLLLDPFDGGTLRFEDQAQELLDRLYGGMVRVQESFLNEATRRDMVVRLLTNLKGIYLKREDDRRALGAIERILVLRPTSPLEIRDRGILLHRMGRHGEALDQLEAYLAFAPEAADAERVAALMRSIRSGGEDDFDG